MHEWRSGTGQSGTIGDRVSRVDPGAGNTRRPPIGKARKPSHPVTPRPSHRQKSGSVLMAAAGGRPLGRTPEDGRDRGRHRFHWASDRACQRSTVAVRKERTASVASSAKAVCGLSRGTREQDGINTADGQCERDLRTSTGAVWASGPLRGPLFAGFCRRQAIGGRFYVVQCRPVEALAMDAAFGGRFGPEDVFLSYKAVARAD